ncbi:DUF412 domain-containing protein [Psychromonas sp. B3M02]|uniref:terminus macrodomain insulation protein YfbV n=1 Tax=Psychromonas sp. B3M02 TaxID=2267226 RepID=UPI000DEB077C|nr:terminus macrodomain insulation protein YfbV [Psychromonas sp. B3M02]RBW46520.1 DUF412 domain-containing protein [Psychromonas sp. B3M02]
MFGFFDLVKKGEHYLKTWPKQACLYSLFIDSKMVCYTQLLIKIFPVFIVLVASLYIIFPVYFSWPSTATFILFLIGLPIHCLLWLGKRSQQTLSPSLFAWYVEIIEVLNGKQPGQQVMLDKPRFIDLAKLLNRGFKKGGDNFLYNNELI